MQRRDCYIAVATGILDLNPLFAQTKDNDRYSVMAAHDTGLLLLVQTKQHLTGTDTRSVTNTV